MSFIKITRSQKGAMFGLDARIALAIFGGLSVIAGAAVFGAISETKVTALITEFDNFSKGYINHALDTGTDTTTVADMWTKPATPNWNGPYLTISTATHPSYGTYTFTAGRPDLTEQVPGTTACSATNLCSIYLTLTNVTNAVAEELDKTVDTPTALTIDTGNVRLTNAAAGVRTVYFKIARCQTDTCS
jgi:hypothetical protein